ncbi:hypothetical protein RYH79_14600 [Halobaculum sp. MBLA0143]
MLVFPPFRLLEVLSRSDGVARGAVFVHRFDYVTIPLSNRVGTPVVKHSLAAVLSAVAAGRLHEVGEPDQTVTLLDVEHDIRECEVVVFRGGERSRLHLGDNRQPQPKFGDLYGGLHHVDTVDVLDDGISPKPPGRRSLVSRVVGG